MYADDLQLCFPLECDGCTSFANFKCLTEVKLWLANIFLQLNENKSEFIMFGNTFGNYLIENGPQSNNRYVKNLGSIFWLWNPLWSASWQHGEIFFKLRKWPKLKPIFSNKDMEIVLHAFISTRLDYCNVLYLGIRNPWLPIFSMSCCCNNLDKQQKTRSYNACIDIPSLVACKIQNATQDVNVCL